MYENTEMRAAFTDTLCQIMKDDPRIMVLSADLGKANGTTRLHTEFPDRALHVGIAEQNMMCIAAGLSTYGFIPFVVTFTAFMARRACDQMAISVSYAKQNVKMIATDPGIAAETNGGTHMSMEDVGIVRSIPGIVIFEPVDSWQMVQALPQIIAYDGPVYVRMLRKMPSSVFDDNYKFDLFKADLLEEGSDVSIFATGLMVRESLDAAALLKEEGIRAEVINVHTLKPLDTQTLLASAKKTGAVVVAENHNVLNGLGSAVCELFAQEYPLPIELVGVPDIFGEVGKLPYLKEKFAMTAQDIAAKARKAVGRK